MMNVEMAIDSLPKDIEPLRYLRAARQEADKAAEVSKMMLIYLGSQSANTNHWIYPPFADRDCPRFRARCRKTWLLRPTFATPVQLSMGIPCRSNRL